MKHALRDSGKYGLYGGKKIVFNLARGSAGGDGFLIDAGCWFCLGNPSINKSLIFRIKPNIYFAMDKGPIVKGHF